MDRFGIDIEITAEQRAETVIELCRRGYAKSMVLSHDASCQLDWLDDSVRPVVLPNWHYGHIHEDVIPALKEGGVTDEQLDDMLVGNPRRYFEGPPE
jgi:phosphotriesterase-related protein